MKKIAILLIALLSPFWVQAGLSNCADLYVGPINVNTNGLYRVVFLENPTDGSGSYWVYFSSLNEPGKNAALSLLVAAQVSGQKVSIQTTAGNACSITADATTATNISLSNRR